MKFLVLSDIHGSVENIEKLDAEFKAADAVIFGGDFAKFGSPETGKPVLDKLLEKHETIFSVIGNCDEPDFLEKIESSDISVEGSVSFYNGLAFVGAGGGTKFSGDTPFERSEDEILEDFSIVKNITELSAEGGVPLIAIMHNPPKDTKCDMIPNGMHVGSEKLRAVIEDFKPLLVVTGHIHESAGIDSVGTSTVINPGSLMEGKYAWVELSEVKKGEWHIDKAELKTL